MDAHPTFSSDGDGRHPTPRDTPPALSHLPERDVVGEPSGSGCPICGPLGQPGDGHAVALDGRPGQPAEALDVWIAHCAARNTALQAAARALAENTALARQLAVWSRERGNLAAAARIEAEAASEAQYYAQVRAMLEDLEQSGPDPT